MSCKSCKNKDNDKKDAILSVFKRKDYDKEVAEREVDADSIVFKFFNISIRAILFIISLITLPVIMLFVIYMLFKTIMLNNGDINLMPALLSLGKTLGIGKRKVENKHPEDYEDLNSNNPEDYEINEVVDKVD